MNIAQVKAIEKRNKQRILAVCHDVTEDSGIYAFVREENGFKYAYVGQAKHLLTRLAQHLSGYQQHIDLSLKKHGLYSEKNPTGWKVRFVLVPEGQLDAEEQKYIKAYADRGYQLRNKTIGGQGVGKADMDEVRSPKGYRDGLAQGYKNAQKFVARLFEKHLDYLPKSDRPNKNQEKAAKKFAEFLEAEDGQAEDCGE